MPRAPHKSCPSLYRLIEHTETNDLAGFFSQDEFSRQKWLNQYCQFEHDTPDRRIFEKLLRDESKSRLEPLEREAARVLTVAENRGQYALAGLAQTKLNPEELAKFKRQKDDLGRSLWIYSNHRLLFEAVENVLHLRLYRRYGKHYQSFQADTSSARPETDPAELLDQLIKEIEARLDMGSGCSVERFDLPAEADHPAAEMYIIYHPNPLTSAREVREDGERRTLYFRPPGEATIVFTPTTGTIEVRADTKVLRRDVAESFARNVLEQDLSSKPLGFREYDLSRFFDSFSLDCPDLDGFHVREARVLKAEISVGHLGNRLSLSARRLGGYRGPGQAGCRHPGRDVSAFAAAMDVLFADPNLARDAVWRAEGTGPSVAVRIMLRQPDRVASFGETRLLADTTMIDVRTADAPVLASVDLFEIGGEAFVVQGEPVRDSARLVWTAELRKA